MCLAAKHVLLPGVERTPGQLAPFVPRPETNHTMPWSDAMFRTHRLGRAEPEIHGERFGLDGRDAPETLLICLDGWTSAPRIRR